MPSTLTRRSGKPRTVTDVIDAGRRMLRADTPTNPREIQERIAAIDAVMQCLHGPHYATDFYRKLGQEWSRLSALQSGGSSRGIMALGMATRSAGGSQSFEEYAAAEAEWQRSPERARLATATALPASWRLPEPSRAKVEPPSIRLDADTEPRVRRARTRMRRAHTQQPGTVTRERAHGRLAHRTRHPILYGLPPHGVGVPSRTATPPNPSPTLPFWIFVLGGGSA